MTVTNDQTGTTVGTGFLFQCGLGADLAIVGNGSITVTNSMHYVTGAGNLLTDINWGTVSDPANPAIVFLICKQGSSFTFATGGNITGPYPYVAADVVMPCVWDGTTWHVGAGPNVGGPLIIPNGSPILSRNGAGTGTIGLVFADGSNFIHMAYQNSAGLYVQSANTSFGRAALPVTHVIQYIGAGQNAAAGASDLTSADGAGVLVGLACYPVLKLTGHDTDHYGAKFWVRSLDDGTARTLDEQTTVIVLAGDKGSNTTVGTMIGVDILEPTGGTTANYGLRNAGTTWLAKHVGIGATPSATYPLWVHLATDANFSLLDSTIPTGGPGVFMSSLTDNAGTTQPFFFSGSAFVFLNGSVQVGNASSPGNIAFASKTVTLANGANTVTDGGAGFVRIAGPTGAFSVNGFDAGIDGQIKRVFNTAAQQMTITNEAAAASAKQITTLTGADVVLRSGKSFSSYIYDGATSKWILTGTN